MKPKTMVFVFFLSCSVLFCIAIGFIYWGLYRQEKVRTTLGISLFLLTTIFASSSKFAKEVVLIVKWENVRRAGYNDYPQTEEQRKLIRHPMASKLREKAVALHNAKVAFQQTIEASVGKEDTQLLGALRAKKHVAEEQFLELWCIMHAADLLPVDPQTRRTFTDSAKYLE